MNFTLFNVRPKVAHKFKGYFSLTLTESGERFK